MSLGYKISVSLIIAILIVIAAYFCFYYISMRHVQEPLYQVLQQDQSIQIRQYQPMIIAEVKVDGDREKAINRGFRLLADYIFGNNHLPQSQQKSKIAMTAPVMQQKSSRINMTAPVMQTEHQGQQWKIRFVMPHDYTLATLPEPNNSAVKIITVPVHTMVVIRFSGAMTKANLQQHLDKLNAYVAEQKLKVTGKPIYAFYNPPWTLPFMRRNEIMYQLTQ